MPPFHYFGIRHHGPGSAYSLLNALDELKPDGIVIEGPPDAHEILSYLTHADMQPPVAILLYHPDEPRRAVYYPFAIFSPEYQALQFALTHNIPARFMDLPQAHQLALEPESNAALGEPDFANPNVTDQPAIQSDPLALIARAAGYDDIERWWEHLIETRRDSHQVFDAILEMMTALRNQAASEDPSPHRRFETLREAYMRETLRAVQGENFKRIAVVSGAWHTPALQDLGTETNDRALLENLPRIPIRATWVPWTNTRLSFAGGYGAGIESPGWYEHLWRANQNQLSPTHVTIEWLAQVAHLLRAQDLDVSSAHLIEATRLAEALAAFRGRPLPDLAELNQAVRTVFCFGSDLPLQLIHDQLIVGNRLGRVPRETPQVPLQHDLEQTQKRLRLPPEALPKTLDLDVRQANDLERSYLLHRLNLLDVPWGKRQRAGNVKGTFHELWQLEWKPEFVMPLIQASAWGNTILDAATARTRDLAANADNLPALTQLLDRALLANVGDALNELMLRIENLASVSSDAANLMDALPPLVNIARYGNVRQTDATAVRRVLDGLIPRLCIGLPNACVALNDDAARALLPRLIRAHQAIALLEDESHSLQWHQTLMQIASAGSGHGLLQGRATRLLLDANAFTPEQSLAAARLALATANDPGYAAAWLEGLLQESGLILVHDSALWQVVDEWVMSLVPDAFTATLPLIRRTFATFTAPERRQLGERAARGRLTSHSANSLEFDFERAAQALPVLERLLGI